MLAAWVSTRARWRKRGRWAFEVTRSPVVHTDVFHFDDVVVLFLESAVCRRLSAIHISLPALLPALLPQPHSPAYQ